MAPRNTAPMKVYGWQSNNLKNPANLNGSHQVRVIVAARSIAEALRLTGDLRSTYVWSGGETGSEKERAIALANPLRPLMRGMNTSSRVTWRDWTTGEVVTLALDLPALAQEYQDSDRSDGGYAFLRDHPDFVHQLIAAAGLGKR